MNTSHLPRHEYTYTPPPTPEERLIAAPPELLAALRDACPVLFTLANGTITNVDREMARAAFEQARAAIARAEGGGR